jgi:MFS family permease
MGTSIFLGYMLSSIMFPRMADIYGRKKLFTSFFLFHIIGTCLILFVPVYYGIYIGLFCVGLASTIRTVVAYVYSLEFFESNHQNIAGTFLKTVDCMTPILFSILFMTVTTNWRVYYYAGLSVATTAWILSFLLPESPAFLVS